MIRRRRKRKRSAGPFLVGAVVLAIAGVLVYLGFTKDIPFVGGEGYRVSAAFKDSSGIKKKSPVRIAGVQVGEVTDVRPEGQGSRSAIVEMKILDNGRPLHRDATFKVRPRIFLEGNFFVEVRPGSPTAPELDPGTTIPVTQTANPVQLDEVLAALTSDTRRDLRRLIASLAEAQLNGADKAFNESLRFQPQAFRFGALAADALIGEQPGDLRRTLDSTATVSAALDAMPEQLKAFIEDFGITANALAAEEDSLRATFDELPRTLGSGLTAMAAVNDALPDLRRFSRVAAPVLTSTGTAARSLTPLIAQLRGLVGEDELRGLLADLRTATPALAQTTKDAIPALGQLRALSSCTSTTLVPFGNDKLEDADFPATGRVFEELPKFLPGLAGESRSFDANGQWFKVLGTGGAETISLGNGLLGTGAQPLVGVNPPFDRTRPPFEPDAPCENQETPELATTPQAAPRSTKQDGPKVAERTRKAYEAAVEVLTAREKAAKKR